jgi:hypothetical protein
MTNQDPQRIRTVPTKRVGISILLTVLSGPLGMFYSTTLGALAMCIISLFVIASTFGLGLFIVWPISIIWGAVATNSYNKEILSGAHRF